MAKEGGKNQDRVATLAQLAERLKKPAATVRQWKQRGMPGRSGRYSVREVEEWLAARERRRRRAQLDPLRRVKAEKAEFELAVLRKKYRLAADVAAFVRWAGAGLRRAAEQLERQFGADAGQALREALEAMEREWQRLAE